MGVARIVLRDVFLLLFFLRTCNQHFFFAFTWENSPVQPLLVSGSLGRKAIPRRRHSMLSSQLLLGGFSHQGIPSSSHPKSYPGHGYLVRLPPRPPTDQLLFYTVHIWLRTACTFVNSLVHFRYRVNLTRSNTRSAQQVIVGLVDHKKVLQWLPRYIFGFGVGRRTTSGGDTPPSKRASQNFTEFSGAGSSLDLESGKGACRHHTHHTIRSSAQG